jgi:hypothetical protein
MDLRPIEPRITRVERGRQFQKALQPLPELAVEQPGDSDEGEHPVQGAGWDLLKQMWGQDGQSDKKVPADSQQASQSASKSADSRHPKASATSSLKDVRRSGREAGAHDERCYSVLSNPSGTERTIWFLLVVGQGLDHLRRVRQRPGDKWQSKRRPDEVLRRQTGHNKPGAPVCIATKRTSILRSSVSPIRFSLLQTFSYAALVVPGRKRDTTVERTYEDAHREK